MDTRFHSKIRQSFHTDPGCHRFPNAHAFEASVKKGEKTKLWRFTHAKRVSVRTTGKPALGNNIREPRLCALSSQSTLPISCWNSKFLRVTSCHISSSIIKLSLTEVANAKSPQASQASESHRQPTSPRTTKSPWKFSKQTKTLVPNLSRYQPLGRFYHTSITHCGAAPVREQGYVLGYT